MAEIIRLTGCRNEEDLKGRWLNKRWTNRMWLLCVIWWLVEPLKAFIAPVLIGWYRFTAHFSSVRLVGMAFSNLHTVSGLVQICIFSSIWLASLIVYDKPKNCPNLVIGPELLSHLFDIGPFWLVQNSCTLIGLSVPNLLCFWLVQICFYWFRCCSCTLIDPKFIVVGHLL